MGSGTTQATQLSSGRPGERYRCRTDPLVETHSRPRGQIIRRAK